MIAPLTIEGKQRIEEVLARAAVDIEFREALLLSPETALGDTELTESERKLLATMKRVALEEWGVDVRKFRYFLADNGYSN